MRVAFLESTVTLVRLVVILALLSPLLAQAQQPAVRQTLVQQVRGEIAKRDFNAASAILAEHRGRQGVTPEWLEAHSWIGRGYLSATRLDDAERSAQETYALAAGLLKTRRMDAEPRLPIAYGAAVEVLAQISAQRGARTDAIVMLERELERHGKTSIAKRVQKNINLLTLEGSKAPALVASDYLGSTPPSLDALKGQALLLFFWAHWCSDCKRMGSVIAALDKQYGDKGLTVVAPTQRYGYVAGGKDAPPDEEKRYIDQIRQASFPVLLDQPVPLDEANHLRYGVSSTPTVVLVDRAGIIRLYHPGQMTLEELQPRVDELLRSRASAQR